jgi:hypothetical protein
MRCQPGNRYRLPASETDRRRRYSLRCNRDGTMQDPQHDPTPRLTHGGWKARKYLPFRSREKNLLDFPSYRTGHSAQNYHAPFLSSCILQAACRTSSVRHRRPPLWDKTESSRIIVAEYFVCPIWIIARRRCLIASGRQRLVGSNNIACAPADLEVTIVRHRPRR